MCWIVPGDRGDRNDEGTGLIAEGASDGSIAESVDVTEAAELLNEIFVGAQVLAGLEDGWRSLPARITRTHGLIRALLTERRQRCSVGRCAHERLA
jgi:hypothetical protein